MAGRISFLDRHRPLVREPVLYFQRASRSWSDLEPGGKLFAGGLGIQFLAAFLRPFLSFAWRGRFPFEAGKWRKNLPVHLASSAVFSMAYIIARAWLGKWQSSSTFAEAFKPLLVKTWHFNLLVYWVIVAVSQASEYYRKFRHYTN